jgi:hypothetical protein
MAGARTVETIEEPRTQVGRGLGTGAWMEVSCRHTVEIEGEERPALVAEAIGRPNR